MTLLDRGVRLHAQTVPVETAGDPASQPYHVGTVSQVRPARREGELSGFGVPTMEKEAVDGRACACHVGAERAEPDELGGERRRGEVVRRQLGEPARPGCAGEGIVERSPAAVPAIAPLLARRSAGRSQPSIPSGHRAGARAAPSSPAGARAGRARSRLRGRAAAQTSGRTGRRRRALPRAGGARSAAAARRA